MEKKEEQILKSVIWPIVLGTVVVVGIALLGRIMSGKQS